MNANTTWFQTTTENPVAVFQVDALKGIIKVDVIPEPATAGLVGLAILAWRCRRPARGIPCR